MCQNSEEVSSQSSFSTILILPQCVYVEMLGGLLNYFIKLLFSEKNSPITLYLVSHCKFVPKFSLS